MPNCEGRSRRSGVVLYTFANGCFAAYTSPPPTAEPLLKEKPFGECISKRSPIAARRSRNYSMHSRGTPILIGAGLAKPDPGGNIQGDGWRLRRSGHAEFSLPRGWGGRWPGPLPVFIQLTFTPKPVLWYFLDSRKYRPPSSPPRQSPSQHTAFAAASACSARS